MEGRDITATDIETKKSLLILTRKLLSMLDEAAKGLGPTIYEKLDSLQLDTPLDDIKKSTNNYITFFSIVNCALSQSWKNTTIHRNAGFAVSCKIQKINTKREGYAYE